MLTDNYSCMIYVEPVRPRETLEGKIELVPSKGMRLAHAYIEYMGEAKCEWFLDKSVYRFPKRYPKGTKMKGSRIFYYSRHNIYNGEEFLPITSKKIFYFTTKFPHGPATWYGKYGSISYRLKITLKTSGFETFTHEEDILVLPNRDLTLEGYLLNECRRKAKRKYKFGSLQLGAVSVSVWLPLCGFAAGQSIPVLVTIDNYSEIKFGGLILVLTMIEIYRSRTPFPEIKTYRKDICRVVRMVDIVAGSYDYYALLEVDQTIPPTNQYNRCSSCHVIYEIWLTLQAAIPRYSGYGYPHLTLSGIPIIIGTTPLHTFPAKRVTAEVMDRLLSCRAPVVMEPPLTKEVEELRDFVDTELTGSIISNLTKQVEENHIEQTTAIANRDLLEAVSDSSESNSINPMSISSSSGTL
ncbi:uncharacterized protein LOC108745016 [Agrilus planipennis]|uniref:Uncharacterized protein LOC108745016 n=1 Tax=Agrilus planipennis TaxID=224129 RepID=A0A1W4XUR3_AGRPL|nr:uncharacterized protein LOC108745016 [Agrilus planipennis]